MVLNSGQTDRQIHINKLRGHSYNLSDIYLDFYGVTNDRYVNSEQIIDAK